MQKLREFFSKKKFVSNDSKSPNSARNEKKKFLVAAEIGGERRRRWSHRLFFKDTKTLGNYWLNQKDFIQLSLKLSD